MVNKKDHKIGSILHCFKSILLKVIKVDRLKKKNQHVYSKNGLKSDKSGQIKKKKSTRFTKKLKLVNL